jgi:6-phosphogluconolactonase (cycloisomerase 2 family)
MRVSTTASLPVAAPIDAAALRRAAAGLAALAWAVLIAAQPVAAGGLSFVEHHPPVANQAIGDVTAIALTNLGTHLYTTSGSENAVGVYSRDPGTGALTFVESHVDTAAGTDDGLASPTGVAATGDGECVYVTSSTENKIAVFARNAGTGALTWVEVLEDGVGGVTGLQQPKAIVATFGQKHV